MTEVQKENVNATSDNEEEVTAREQLKKASIDADTIVHPDDGTESVPEAESAEQEADPISIDSSDAHQNGNSHTAEISDRGRPVKKKRSFHELEDEELESTGQAATSGKQPRKRSRDSTAEEVGAVKRLSGEETRDEFIGESEGNTTNGTCKSDKQDRARSTTPVSVPNATEERSADVLLSPKTKRSRLEHAKGEDLSDLTEGGEAIEKSENGERKTCDVATTTAGITSTATAETKSLESQAKVDTSETTKVAPTSGFSNASASSPFGALAGNKSPTSQSQGSTSAFASSAFGALANSSTSGFGSLGKATGLSSFASPAKEATKSPEKAEAVAKPSSTSSSTSAFGGFLGSTAAFSSTSGTSTFGGASGSGFSKLGSGGFGSSSAFGGGSGFGAPLGQKLSGFGGGSGVAVLGSSSKSSKAFGAPLEDDDDASDAEDDDAPGIKSPKEDTERKDERFYAQEVETGEENETTEYTCRAKLYNFVKGENEKKEWKERGLGTVRLNVKNMLDEDGEPSALKARLVMRADGSHRVILNTPIQKELSFGSVTGDRPTGGYIIFMGSVDNEPKLDLLQLKMRQQFASELYDRVKELQHDM